MKKMMTVLIAVTFICSTLLFTTSCAKKQTITEPVAQPAQPDDGFKPEIVYPKDEIVVEEPPMSKMEIEKRERQFAINVIEAGSIYFDFDRSELKDASKAVLTKKADYLRKFPDLSIRIEGHCDERGTNEYNLALGERRANAAFKFLNALGIAGDRLITVSYGEELPVDQGHNESAWAKNRRDDFKIAK